MADLIEIGVEVRTNSVKSANKCKQNKVTVRKQQ